MALNRSLPPLVWTSPVPEASDKSWRASRIAAGPSTPSMASIGASRHPDKPPSSASVPPRRSPDAVPSTAISTAVSLRAPNCAVNASCSGSVPSSRGPNREKPSDPSMSMASWRALMSGAATRPRITPFGRVASPLTSPPTSSLSPVAVTKFKLLTDNAPFCARTSASTLRSSRVPSVRRLARILSLRSASASTGMARQILWGALARSVPLRTDVMSVGPNVPGRTEDRSAWPASRSTESCLRPCHR